MAQQKPIEATSRDAAPAPLRWWAILAREDSSCLPFAGYFDELTAAEAGNEEEIMKTERIIEPITNTWQPHHAESWGRNTEFIEDWFEEGEQIVNSKEELEIDEPAQWERVLHWMRSVAVATGLMPA